MKHCSSTQTRENPALRFLSTALRLKAEGNRSEHVDYGTNPATMASSSKNNSAATDDEMGITAFFHFQQSMGSHLKLAQQQAAIRRCQDQLVLTVGDLRVVAKEPDDLKELFPQLGVRVHVKAWFNHNNLPTMGIKTDRTLFELSATHQEQPPPQPLQALSDTETIWQSILRITSDVEGDVSTALVFDIYQTGDVSFLYLLTSEHYQLGRGNIYSLQHCRHDNIFVTVDQFEYDDFEVWKFSKDNNFVIYKLALSDQLWNASPGVAQRKAPQVSQRKNKRPRNCSQCQQPPMDAILCKTPTFWFEGVHPLDEMCVFALPASIPGRWACQTSVTHVDCLTFCLQALTAPGASGGAVLATKSGKVAGFIGGTYDVKEPESTNPNKLVDRRFNTYAFSVHALPRRLSSPPSRKPASERL